MDEPLSPNQARKLLSRILHKGTVVYSTHALREMKADGLEEADVVAVLRVGQIYEPAECVNDSWRYRVHSQRVCVVVTFDGETVVVVVTTWKKKR